jgi:hypothetical protein
MIRGNRGDRIFVSIGRVIAARGVEPVVIE